MWSFLKKSAPKPLGTGSLLVNANGFLYAHLLPDQTQPKILYADFVPFSNEKELPTALANYVKTHELKKADCTYVLQPHEYQLFLIDTPAVNPEEVRNAARWAVMDFINMPLEEVGVDVFEMPVAPHQPGKSYVVVTPITTLKKIDRLMKNAGFVPARIDIMELACLSGVRYVSEDDAIAAALFFDAFKWHLVIFKGDTLYLERTIESTKSAPHEKQVVGHEDLSSLISAIQESFTFYQNQLGEALPKTLYLDPLLAEQTNFIAEIKTALNITPTMASTKKIQDKLTTLPREKQMKMIVALGGALGTLLSQDTVSATADPAIEIKAIETASLPETSTEGFIRPIIENAPAEKSAELQKTEEQKT